MPRRLLLLLCLSAAPAAAAQDTASSLLSEAVRLAADGDPAASEQVARRALALAEAAPDSARALEAVTAIAWALAEQGRDADAVGWFERAYRGWGAAGTDAAYAALDLAEALHRTGAYARAARHAEEADRRLAAVYGPDAPERALALNLRALVAFVRGDLSVATEAYERALEIVEADPDAHPDDLAALRGNLAAVRQQAGDFQAARDLLDAALQADEQTHGPDDPRVAGDLDRLAYLLRQQGDVAAALPLQARAVAILRAAYGPDDPGLAGPLQNLGAALAEAGRPDSARAVYHEALGIPTLADDAPLDLARTLRGLALLDAQAGRWTDARAHLDRALAVQERALGPDHDNVAETLADLADVALRAGDLGGARQLADRALQTWERTVGPDHYTLVRGLLGRAAVAAAAGDAEAERDALLRAAGLLTRHLDGVLPVLSAAEQHAFLDAWVPRATGLLLSRIRPDDAFADAYAALSSWRGRLAFGLRQQVAIARLTTDPLHGDAARQLADVRADLAAWVRAAPSTDPEVWSDRQLELTAEKERLERALSRALPASQADPLAGLGPGGIGAALPERAAFVDVYRYDEGDGLASTPHYAAVVTVHGGAPQRIDLGAAEAIDALVEAWRGAVLSGRAADPETLSLARALWEPVAAGLPPDVRRAWVAPDGPLARVPWATLAREHRPLEGVLVAEVSSARDLVALLQRPASDAAAAGETRAVVVGGVDFGPGTAWAPLPGTAAEVDALLELAIAATLDARVLTGSAPTPDAVAEALPGADYVHLATHGFFYRAPPSSAVASRSGLELGLEVEDGPARAASRSPLAESGLAFAGANGGPAGLLTAEQMVGLDLGGTRLVTLSACDTGRGTEVTGQGVLGLRAAIRAAGAEAVLMSLWEVPDASTAALMERFYAALWSEGHPPAKALRLAQDHVRSDPRWRAPVYWAAWTLAGAGW